MPATLSPAAPTGLAATPLSPTQIDLTWATSDEYVLGYNIYRSTTPGGENYGAPLNGGTPCGTAIYYDTTATPGTTYYYTVEAVNGAGASVASAEVSALTAPAAPTNVNASPVSTTQINLSWTAAGGTVAGYNIYRGAASGWEGVTPINSAPVTSTSYSDQDLTAGTAYYYTVEAVNASGSSIASNETGAWTLSAAPTGLVGTPVSASKINLSWTAPADAISGYNIYRGTSAGAENYAAPLNGGTPITATAYSDTTVNSGTTYYYTVEAINAGGGSAASNEGSALTCPAAPTGLLATPISASQINLSWTAPAGTVAGYNLYRGASAGAENYAAPINGGTPVAATTYDDTTVSGGTTYYYTVEVVNASGSSVASSEGGALTCPAAPTGLTATAVSTAQINLSWTAPAGTVTGYNIYRGTTGGGESATPINGGTPVTTTTYSDSGLTAGTTYYYIVKAVNASGSSIASNESSASTSATPAAPTGLIAAQSASTGELNLSWTAPSGTVTGYNIYRGTTGGGESTTPINGGTPVTTTTYTDTALTAGTKYYYTVKAVNAYGSGPASTEASQTTVAALSLPSSLVAYWRMDEDSGSIVYDTATGGSVADVGYIENGATWTTGKIGNALSFSSSAFVYVSNSTDLQITGNTITLACWAKGNTSAWSNFPGAFLMKNAAYLIRPYGSYGVQAEFYIGGAWQSASYSPGSGSVNTWNQYAAVYNGSAIQLYINGAAVGTATQQSGNLSNTSQTLYLGLDASTGYYFSGSLDEVRVYNSALSASNIAALYNQAALSATNVTHGTAKNFALIPGTSTQFSDASYTFSSSTTMSQFTGATYIQTAQADRLSTANQLVSFTTNTPCVAYVLYDTDITGTNRATWLSMFADTGTSVANSNGHTFEVYKLVLSSGTLTLGGNLAAGGTDQSGEMYTVILLPLCWNSNTNQVV
jgi:fibronectin type 3 domain-containing protein